MSGLSSLSGSFYLHLPILIIVISLVYSATRFDRWGSIFREAFRWGSRMATFLVALAIVVYILSLLI